MNVVPNFILAARSVELEMFARRLKAEYNSNFMARSVELDMFAYKYDTLNYPQPYFYYFSDFI